MHALLLQVVDELLQQLGATGDEGVQTPSWHYTEDPQHSTAAAADGSISLRHALSVCYDIKTPKAQQLLQLLLAQLQQQQQQGSAKGAARVSIDVRADASTTADLAAAGLQQQSTDGKQQDAAAAAVSRLQGLLAEPAALEQYLAARHVADVLQDFPQVDLSYSQVSSAWVDGSVGNGLLHVLPGMCSMPLHKMLACFITAPVLSAASLCLHTCVCIAGTVVKACAYPPPCSSVH
jgi:hypothetical protein